MDWHPTQFFRTSPAPSPFALLVLNQPINENAFGVLHKHGTSIPTPLHKPAIDNECNSNIHDLRRRRRKPVLRADERARRRNLQCIYLSTPT